MRRFGVCAALFAAACIDDLGDLSKPPPIPETATPPLFSFPDASVSTQPDTAVSPPPASTMPENEPEPPAGIPEPTGRPTLTLMHGVVDAPTLQFCFVASGADGVAISAVPEPPAGLRQGQVFVVGLDTSNGGGFDASTRDLLPIAVAAEPDALEGRSCESLLGDFGYVFDADLGELELLTIAPSGATAPDAGVPLADGGVPLDASVFPEPIADASAPDDGDAPSAAGAGDSRDGAPRDAASGPRDDAGADAGFPLPEVRFAELNRFPAGSFGSYSYLLVASGCIGAAGLRHDQEALLCGAGFVAARSSFTGVLVQLSRQVDFGALGLQFVNASQALPEATLRSNPGEQEGAFLTVASNVLLGAIAPSYARRSFRVEEIGVLGDVALEVSYSPTNETLFAVPWSDALAPNATVLRDGRAFSFVLVGPVPGVPEGWWNPPLLATIKNDPLRPE